MPWKKKEAEPSKSAADSIDKLIVEFAEAKKKVSTLYCATCNKDLFDIVATSKFAITFSQNILCENGIHKLIPMPANRGVIAWR